MDRDPKTIKSRSQNKQPYLKWVNQLLEIIVKEYIESTSQPSVIIGMKLLRAWGESEKALRLIFPFASRLIPLLIQKSAITEQINVSKGNTGKMDYAEMEKKALEDIRKGEFLRICFKLVDSDNLPRNNLNDIVPPVGQLIKSGVGVNARGMAIYIAGRIGLRWKTAASEVIGKALAPVIPVLTSSSEALRNEAGAAIPCLLSAASEKTKNNFTQRIEKLYFESRDEDKENSIGYAMDGAVKKMEADLAPFVGPICWLGRFDPKQERSFSSAWEKGEFNVRQIGEEIAM